MRVVDLVDVADLARIEVRESESSRRPRQCLKKPTAVRQKRCASKASPERSTTERDRAVVFDHVAKISSLLDGERAISSARCDRRRHATFPPRRGRAVPTGRRRGRATHRQVLERTLGVKDQTVRETRGLSQHVDRQLQGVGQHDALDARVRDVALVPECDVLESRLQIPAKHSRSARRVARRVTGFRLCGIAEEPFCPAAKGSSASPTSLRARSRTSRANCSIVVPIAAHA